MYRPNHYIKNVYPSPSYYHLLNRVVELAPCFLAALQATSKDKWHWQVVKIFSCQLGTWGFHMLQSWVKLQYLFCISKREMSHFQPPSLIIVQFSTFIYKTKYERSSCSSNWTNLALSMVSKMIFYFIKNIFNLKYL